MRNISTLTYNGGQKCWDLFSDITKTSDPYPPLPPQTKLNLEQNGRLTLFRRGALLEQCQPSFDGHAFQNLLF